MERARLTHLVPAAVAGIGVGLLLISFGSPAHTAAVVTALVGAVLSVSFRYGYLAALTAGAGATSLLMQIFIWVRCEVGSPTQPCMDIGFAQLFRMAVLITLISVIALAPVVWAALTPSQHGGRHR